MSSNIGAARKVRFAPAAIAVLFFSFMLALGNRPLVWAQGTDSSGPSAAKQSVDKQSALYHGKQSEQTPEQKMAAQQKRLEDAAERDALDQVKQEQWIVSLKRFRDPLGPVVTRTAAHVDFTKTLRGAPDGDYAIIHFTTTFKNKSDVTERLTLVKEDGKWQAAAYAIH